MTKCMRVLPVLTAWLLSSRWVVTVSYTHLSMEHPGAAARLFKEFAKANAKFEVKAAAFEGELIPASQIDRLATLPTYEEAIARLMATMKEASAGKLVRTLAAVRDAKEAA